MPTPKFLYFDLGNVLVRFDDRRSCAQMAAVAGISTEKVWNLIFGTDLKQRYESGEIDDRGFFETFCRTSSTRPEYQALLLAGSDIFTPNLSIFPVVAGLRAAGFRMGVLSNTCCAHWEFVVNRYALVAQSFDVFALSYQLGACKPSARIYRRAAELAGVAPEEVFFVDDIAGHVTGAKAAGFDAVQYTSTPELVCALRARGLRFNY